MGSARTGLTRLVDLRVYENRQKPHNEAIMNYYILTTYHDHNLVAVYHYRMTDPTTDDWRRLYAWIRAHSPAGITIGTAEVDPDDAREMPVDWSTVPGEFAQALARVAATERSF